MTNVTSISPAISRRRVGERLRTSPADAVVDVSDLTVDWSVVLPELKAAGVEIDRPAASRGSGRQGA